MVEVVISVVVDVVVSSSFSVVVVVLVLIVLLSREVQVIILRVCLVFSFELLFELRMNIGVTMIKTVIPEIK